MPNPTRLVVGPGEGDNAQFGKLLEEFRTTAKLTRAQAAHYLGFSSEYLRLIERGLRVPALGGMSSLLNVYRITHEMGVDYVTFGSYTVEFTSRIREPRGGAASVTQDNRNEVLGQIVRLLTSADDATLHEVHRVLRRAS